MSAHLLMQNIVLIKYFIEVVLKLSNLIEVCNPHKIEMAV